MSRFTRVLVGKVLPCLVGYCGRVKRSESEWNCYNCFQIFGTELKMKFSYKFSNLLGSVYHKGNVVFAPDGETLLSPVGNKVTLYDLKRSRSQTMPVESKTNITTLALSPNGRLLITVNERGEALLISMLSMTVVHRHRFHRPVHAVRFSPDGRYFALTKENLVFVYRTPGGVNRMYNPFVLERVLQGSFDSTLSLAWTSDSRLVAASSSDMSTRIYPVQDMTNFGVTALGGHSAAVLAVFFERDSLDCYTLSRNGQLCCWTCSHTLDELKHKTSDERRPSGAADEPLDDEEAKKKNEDAEDSEGEDDAMPRAKYKQRAKQFLVDLVRESGGGRVELSAADFHQGHRVLVTGYTNGSFLIHEMPDVVLIHSLSVSDQVVSSVAFSPGGDWVGLACSGLGQLLVWEWQSETYVLKQQGHSNNMTSLTYSPGGELLATGGEDGKVKVWNTLSGFCFVTFVEHTAAVSGVAFTQSGKAVVSSSLDGTVRAFDMTRYRNFRTLTSPRPAQFSCLAVDSSGDLVAAGAQDLFEIYLWSLQLGKLLEVMSGHAAPVSGLAFSPDPTATVLASVSWDKTLRLWDTINSKGHREAIHLFSDGLAVAYRPDGGEVAVATLSGQIQLFDTAWSTASGVIEGRNDLGSGRADSDQITAKKSLQGKAFNTLCYTADGKCVLAAGQSKNVCIYHVGERLLLAKFEITQNRSFDAVDDFIHKRKMTEFGNLSLVESRGEDVDDIHLRMPGARRGDMAARALRPEIRVLAVRFSPTGEAWGAVTTEGLLIYSLDPTLVFEPFQLEEDITEGSVLAKLKSGDHARALLMALHLNVLDVTRRVVETVPLGSVEALVTSLPHRYIEKLLAFVAAELEATRHLEFYVLWAQAITREHAAWLRSHVLRVTPLLRQLQKALTTKQNTLGRICDHNRYLLQYLDNLGRLRSAEPELKRPAEDSAGSDLDEALNGTLDEDEDEDLAVVAVRNT